MFQTFISRHNSNFFSDKLVLTSVTPASSAPVLQTPKATSSTLYFDSLTVNAGNGGFVHCIHMDTSFKAANQVVSFVVAIAFVSVFNYFFFLFCFIILIVVRLILVFVVFFFAFIWLHLSTPLIRLFLLVLILLLMPTLNFLPVWFALSLLRFRLPSRLPMMFILWMVAMMVVIIPSRTV